MPDTATISITAGGTQKLTLDAGTGNAGSLFWIFGSMTGTTPGISIFGPHMYLNPDPYTDLALGVDEIAERIRTLGFPAPGSYTEFAALATVKEALGKRTAVEMINELVEDQGIVVNTAARLVAKMLSYRELAKG